MIKTCYKKDSKGKIRIWRGSAENGIITQESGLLMGKTVINTTVCKPKNVGKSNETTKEQQAELELISKYTSKLNEGYFDTVEEAKVNLVHLPMLAKTYSNEKSKIDWNNCYCQPKLDGQRILGLGFGKLISRDGIEITTLDHLKKDLISGYVIDGEGYAHGLSFQENMKAIKKYRKGITEQVKYHLYDIVLDKPFSERYEILKDLIKDKPNYELVKTFKITSEQELYEYHKKFLGEGYEGTIVRWGDNSYQLDSRSSNLLKLKDFIEIDALLIDVKPAEQRPEWGTPVLTANGKQFDAGTKMSHQERIDFLKNKSEYIGQTAVIRFFEYTDDGKPRFPVLYGFRNDNQIKSDEIQ